MKPRLEAWREELAIREELARRQKLVEGFFEDQQTALDNPHRRKALLWGRRDGKTTLLLRAAIRKGKRYPHTRYPYIAKSQKTARWITWPVLEQVNRDYELGMQLRSTTLEAILPGGSIVALFGADRDDLQDTIQGAGSDIGDVMIDEAALWRTDLRRFTKDVVEPILFDRGGTLWMAGAPSDVLTGYYYDVTRPEVELREAGWWVSESNVERNPYMAKQWAQQLIEFERDYGPGFREMAWFIRQWLGRWCPDAENNVYEFLSSRNVVRELRKTIAGDRHVLGMDTGYSAGMAFVVCRYNIEEGPGIVVPESFWQAKMSNDEIAAKVRYFLDRYPGMTIVADPANEQLLVELASRYHLPINPADKTNKRDWIRTLNNELAAKGADGSATPRLHVYVPDADDGENPLGLGPDCNEHLVRELTSLKKRYGKDGVWDEDLRTSSNHCTDGLLYAFRYCHPYLHRPKQTRPEYGTDAWVKEQEKRMLETRLKQVRQDQRKRKRHTYGRVVSLPGRVCRPAEEEQWLMAA